MLSIEAARQSVLANVEPLPSAQVPIAEAAGRRLAISVKAASDVPRFDNSAMDGFAALAGPAGRNLSLVGESRAGAPFLGEVGDGEAIRISTGAQVPAGDEVGVLQLELAEDHGMKVEFSEALKPGRNIRRAGEDLRAGAEVLAAGRSIGPAEISVAINAGESSVACSLRPRVAIINTGDELVAPGEDLGPGQIHDSNGMTLAALARQSGAEVVSVAVARDTAGATRDALERGLDADVVIASGGVSVGPHDHVKEQLRQLGVKERFWRVALRPGKPTWFGTKGKTLVFGLPGNPVSVYVTFILFVRPALMALQGADPDERRTTARMAVATARNSRRDECVRVTIADGMATPTGAQGSHVTSSLLGADAIATITRGEGEVDKGELVPIEWL